MRMADVLSVERHDFFRGSAWPDQLGLTKELRDSLLDLGAGFRAGDDEGLVPDA